MLLSIHTEFASLIAFVIMHIVILCFQLCYALHWLFSVQKQQFTCNYILGLCNILLYGCSIVAVCMYRVAQNKIPYRRICNTPQPVIWFLKFLKLFNPDTSPNLRYTMHPLHLNYTTTLPCKTITMKITIFIIVLVLKSNENMEIWHFRLSQLANSSKPCKTVYFKTCSKCPPQTFTQARSLFTKLSMALLMEFYVCKTFVAMGPAGLRPLHKWAVPPRINGSVPHEP